MRSRARVPGGTGTEISTSAMVWVHLYGRAACSAACLAAAALSSASEGVSEEDISIGESVIGCGLFDV